MLYGFALTWMVKSKSIALFFHIFVHIKSLCWKFVRPTPPLVSNCQHLAHPPSPPRQQLSAFGLPPLPPLAADVICERPLIRGGVKNKTNVDSDNGNGEGAAKIKGRRIEKGVMDRPLAIRMCFFFTGGLSLPHLSLKGHKHRKNCECCPVSQLIVR